MCSIGYCGFVSIQYNFHFIITCNDDLFIQYILPGSIPGINYTYPIPWWVVKGERF